MSSPPHRFGTLEEFRAWCEAAPPRTQVDAQTLVEILSDLEEPPTTPLQPDPDDGQVIEQVWTWRERVWVAPADTRLSASDVAEVLGRPRSWVYERTRRSRGRGRDRRPRRPNESIPHRKIGGSLVFVAGELRDWIQRQEERIVGGPGS